MWLCLVHIVTNELIKNWCTKKDNVADWDSRHKMHTRCIGTSNVRFEAAQNRERLLLYERLKNILGNSILCSICDKFCQLSNKGAMERGTIPTLRIFFIIIMYIKGCQGKLVTNLSWKKDKYELPVVCLEIYEGIG